MMTVLAVVTVFLATSAFLDDVRGANDLHALLIHPSDAVLAVVVGALFAVATSVSYIVIGMLL